MQLRVAGFSEESIVDGPGIRFTVFVQGCPHNCKGCHNPQTHDFSGGRIEDTDDIFQKIIKDKILDGVTFSGGEPFCQCKALSELAEKIRNFNEFKLNIISYTGYTFEYLIKNANEENGYLDLLKKLDYLVDGPFVLEQKSLDLNFRGSRNQRFIDVQKSLESGKVIQYEPE